jgi:hypothetical protein
MFNLSQANALNAILANPTLALGGAATTHSHAASLPVVVGGIFATSPTGTVTPTTNSSPQDFRSVGGAVAAGLPLTITAPAAATQFRGALVVWTVDAAGTKRIRSRGFFESNGEPLALEFPEIPVTEVPLGYHTLRAISTLVGTWTFGSNNWTGVTGLTAGAVVQLPGMLPAARVTLA